MNWKLDPQGPKDCLIVDDDPAVVETLTMYCENLGVFRNIVAAEDGKIASTKMSNQRFALILIDINMPKKDGLSLIKDFFSLSNKNDVQKVVVISGELDKEKLAASVGYGVKNFLIKPFDEETFQEKIRPALQMANG